MLNCLETFCEASGQKICFEKSLFLCSPNTHSDIATNISLICGSPLAKDLGKYLGVPLIHSRITKSTYREIVEKVQSKLASWKAKSLSLAGRATLIQSVISAIPIYAMQTVKLPASVCKKVDQLNKRFLWGGSADKAKVHLVKWSQVCCPKVNGA